jgi:hypothetical protein
MAFETFPAIVAVDPRHRLPLTLLSIIQSSKEQFKWNIQLTQVKCDSVQRIQGELRPMGYGEGKGCDM